MMPCHTLNLPLVRLSLRGKTADWQYTPENRAHSEFVSHLRILSDARPLVDKTNRQWIAFNPTLAARPIK